MGHEIISFDKAKKWYVLAVVLVIVVIIVFGTYWYFNSPQYALLRLLDCMGTHDRKCIESLTEMNFRKQILPSEMAIWYESEYTPIVIRNISYIDSRHVKIWANVSYVINNRKGWGYGIFYLVFNETWKISQQDLIASSEPIGEWA